MSPTSPSARSAPTAPTAAGDQSLMINRLVAAWALSMLYDFLVTRDLRYFAVALDARWAGVRTYPIDAPTIAEACGLAAYEVEMKGEPHGNGRQARTR